MKLKLSTVPNFNVGSWPGVYGGAGGRGGQGGLMSEILVCKVKKIMCRKPDLSRSHWPLWILVSLRA